jgi:16S rRNA (guanine527-N7)-methyltransferase
MFHVKHEDRVRDAARLGVVLDRETARRLEVFEGLLRDRAIAMGLVAERDRHRIWERHVLDSIRGAPLVPRRPERRLRIADLGSGAGLPGIPIAVVRPDVDVVLVEPKQRRAGFLELVVERLGLANADVQARGAGELTGPFDVCLARALASPPRVWELAEPLLGEGGRLLAWIGAGEPALPRQVRVRVAQAPHLVNAGAIAIMTRQ